MKSIYKTLIILFVLVSTSACDDFYELENPPVSPWQSVADFDATVAGVYYNLTGSGGNQAIMSNRRGFSTLTTDIGVFLDGAGGDGSALGLYDRDNGLENSWLNSVFRSSYGSIQSANLALDFLATGPFQGSSDRDQLIRLEGELLFLRAYCYWSLVKAFAPPFEPGSANSAATLPLRLTSVDGLESAVNNPPAPTGDIYTAIIADLERAVELLPERFDSGRDFATYEFGRANKFAAAFLLARVHFQMGNTTAAQEQLDFVINTGVGNGFYNLSQDPIVAFTQTWNGENEASEILWMYSYGETPRQNGLGTTSNWKVPRRFRFYNLISRFFRTDNDETLLTHRNNQKTVATSDAFLEQAGWMNLTDRSETQTALNDKRYTQLFVRVEGGTDADFSGSITETRVWNARYYRWPGGRRAGQGTSIPMFRLAEAYLTRSIIRFNNGDAAGAAEDLNVVRARAWDADAAGTAYTPVTAADITAEMIHNERMIEMAFEGDRLHYLQALQLPIPNGDRGPGSIPYNDPSLFWPLPQSEIDLNQGL